MEGRTKVIERIIGNKIQKANVPRRWQKAKLSDFTEIDNFQIENLFITGGPGTGKTHLMGGMIRGLFEQNPHSSLKIKFISAPQLLQLLRSSYAPNSPQSESEIINTFTSLDWLFLDDLGADNASEWVRSSLYLIIDKIYQEERNIVVSSNLDLSKISKDYDDRLASRLMEMCKILKMTGEDRRMK